MKWVNGMPFPFTMRHYQIFGASTDHMKDAALMSSDSWDTLREEHPFFAIAETREAWLEASELRIKKDGQDERLIERAKDIATLVTSQRFDRIFSVGAGGAALEYQLTKLLPGVPIVCSDYSSTTVERLKTVFTEATDVVTFDILEGDWGEVNETYVGPKGLCLIYRLDAGFSDDDWRRIFARMHDAAIRNVLVIPTGTLTLLSVYNRKRRELSWVIAGTKRIWSGYVRTKTAFLKQWGKGYHAKEGRFGGLVGFLLQDRRGS